MTHFRAAYRRNARTMTSLTVTPSTAARAFTAAHKSSGTRTLRIGVCVSRATSGPNRRESGGARVGMALGCELSDQSERASHSVRGGRTVPIALHWGTHAGEVGAAAAVPGDALGLCGFEERGPFGVGVHGALLSSCRYTVAQACRYTQGVVA